MTTTGVELNRKRAANRNLPKILVFPRFPPHFPDFQDFSEFAANPPADQHVLAASAGLARPAGTVSGWFA